MRYSILNKYYFTLKLYKNRRIFFKDNIIYIITEMIIIFIHPSIIFNYEFCFTMKNFFDNNITISEINNLFDILIFFQLIFKNFFIIRGILYFYKYNNDKSRRLFLYFHEKPSFLFGLKAMIKDNYFYFLFLNFSNVIFIGALLIQYNEYNVNKDLKNLFDCIWFITITITTVGYGSRTPIKILSKITTALISWYGSFILSFVILIISNNLDLKIWEVISTLILKKIKWYFNLKKLNLDILKETLSYKLYKKKMIDKEKKLIYKYNKLKKIGKLSYIKSMKKIEYKNEKKKNYYSDEIDTEMKNIIKKIKILNEKFDKKLRNKGIIYEDKKKKKSYINKIPKIKEKLFDELEENYKNKKK